MTEGGDARRRDGWSKPRFGVDVALEDVEDPAAGVVHLRIVGRIMPLCGWANTEPVRGPSGIPPLRLAPCPVCEAAAGRA